MYHNTSNELQSLLKNPETKDITIVVYTVKTEKRFLQLLIDIIPISVITFILSFFFDNKYLYVFSYFFYFLICEGIFHTSLGKKVMGHRIIVEDFIGIDMYIILVRTFCRMIPFDALTCMGDYSYGLHDKLSNTYVVSESEYKRIEKYFIPN